MTTRMRRGWALAALAAAAFGPHPSAPQDASGASSGTSLDLTPPVVGLAASGGEGGVGGEDSDASSAGAIRAKTNQVLIMTQGRSGSSFIGELLSKIPGALYVYEPCRSLTMTKSLKPDGTELIHFGAVPEPQCQAMAARVLGCQITQDDADHMFKDFVAIGLCNFRAIVELSSRKVQPPKKVSEYNRMCRQAPLRILKEIRLNTPGQALRVREEASVLHLVRDIRAVVNSRLRIDGFCLHHGAPGCAQPVCEGMAASASGMAAAPLSHGRYRLVRYEDVCVTPLEHAVGLYKWLGFAWTKAAEVWVNASTHKADAPSRAGAYGTARADPVKVSRTWETQLGEPAITKIGEMCGDVLKAFGYDPAVPAAAVGTSVPPPAYKNPKKAAEKVADKADGGGSGGSGGSGSGSEGESSGSEGGEAKWGGGGKAGAGASSSPSLPSSAQVTNGGGGGGGGGGGRGGGKVPAWKAAQLKKAKAKGAPAAGSPGGGSSGGVLVAAGSGRLPVVAMPLVVTSATGITAVGGGAEAGDAAPAKAKGAPAWKAYQKRAIHKSAEANSKGG